MQTLFTLSALSIAAQAIRLDLAADKGSNQAGQQQGGNKDKGDHVQRFAAWAAKHGRNYKNADEHTKRLEAWKKKDDEYTALNQNPDNTFKLDHSPISDLLPEEFAALLLPPELVHQTLAQTFAQEESECVCPEGCGSCDCNDFGIGQPDGGLDWRTAANNPAGLNAVNPVDSQGMCNSCWAFALTAQQETQNYIQNPSQGLHKYSEQQLIDCNPLGFGCPYGGNSRSIVRSWLIPDQVQPVAGSLYPYTGTSDTCKTDLPVEQALAQDYTAIYSTGKPDHIKQALEHGPVLTQISAGSAYFYGYSSGILNNQCCFESHTLNHTVLTVGWGV